MQGRCHDSFTIIRVDFETASFLPNSCDLIIGFFFAGHGHVAWIYEDEQRERRRRKR